MDLSYCVTGNYPNSGQPPGCYYNSNGDFIGIDYSSQETILLENKQFDYDKNGNKIVNGQAVKGNITSVRMPPNGWTEFYTTNACCGAGGIIANGSSEVEDLSNQVSCMRVGSSMPWKTYVDQCEQGIGDQELCQQYKYTKPIDPPINSYKKTEIKVVIVDPDNNRWWLYLTIGIFLFACIFLVLSGSYITSTPRSDDIPKVKPPSAQKVSNNPPVVQNVSDKPVGYYRLD